MGQNSVDVHKIRPKYIRCPRNKRKNKTPKSHKYLLKLMEDSV